MSTWTNAVLTNQGATLLAKLTQGTTLSITSAYTGTGYVTPADLPAQTAVSGQRQQLTFRTVTYPEEGKCAIPMVLSNDTVNTAYTATQIGVYANDPDNGTILLIIAQALSGAGTDIPSATQMPGFSAEWTFYVQYGNADGVTVTVDPSGTVSQSELNQAVATINAALATKANQTDMTAAQTAISQKLPLAGGIMTGNIQMRTTNYTSTPVKVTDSGTTYGQLLQIGAGGDVVIGSGESANNLPSAEGITGENETMNISSDSTISFFTNCNTIGNRKEVQINNSGQIIVPTAPTADMQLANKQYVDNLANAKQKTITSGTAAPSGGSNGDIYIQY